MPSTGFQAHGRFHRRFRPPAAVFFPDDMLARFAKNVRRSTTATTGSSPTTSTSFGRRAISPGGPRGIRRRRPVAGRGDAASSGVSATMPRRRRWRSTCTSTGSGSPPISGGAATSRCSGCSKRRRRARCSRPGMPRAGNDIPMLLSTTKAERVEGGYRFTGRKSFGSLSPVWTYLGIHGMDTADAGAEDRPRLHAARDRGLSHRADLGRAGDAGDAQRRHDPRRRVRAGSVRRRASCRPARPGSTTSCSGSSPGRSIGFGNIYYGLARRALDMTIETVKAKRSIGITRTMAYHAELQHRIAEMGLAIETIGPHLDRIAEDWSNGVDHGAAWPAKIFAAKYHAVEESWRVVDLALDVAGGFGIFREERARTAVPRCPAGPHPPGQLDADARDRRQDAARNQSGRNATLGLAATWKCRVARDGETRIGPVEGCRPRSRHACGWSHRP